MENQWESPEEWHWCWLNGWSIYWDPICCKIKLPFHWCRNRTKACCQPTTTTIGHIRVISYPSSTNVDAFWRSFWCFQQRSLCPDVKCPFGCRQVPSLLMTSTTQWGIIRTGIPTLVLKDLFVKPSKPPDFVQLDWLSHKLVAMTPDEFRKNVFWSQSLSTLLQLPAGIPWYTIYNDIYICIYIPCGIAKTDSRTMLQAFLGICISVCYSQRVGGAWKSITSLSISG